ncbi:hypothetical protein JOF28_001386 [Leucobacter exalbidus]|uniref:DUF7882 domain-containing protein n=1 Tax=Leucobacter exalbidus TaxID=662960 RepID=A0A940PVP1_9MICO|nr:hypothetical protein [Leucobacter exalbidus]MBP1326154.1 hypothetical protein [Leucobacter exalbidus]
MGHLIYAATTEYPIEDRALAHLKAAVGMKLRLQESFFINWSLTHEEGSGRISLWCAPSIPLIFKFSGSRPIELNQVWVEVLTDLANTPRGLQIITEKDAERYHSTHRA